MGCEVGIEEDGSIYTLALAPQMSDMGLKERALLLYRSPYVIARYEQRELPGREKVRAWRLERV